MNFRNSIQSIHLFTAICSYLQREIGGYLTRLENDFNIIKKRIPMFSKAESRNVRYEIEDNREHITDILTAAS